MRLRVSTPSQVLVDVADVCHVRAEDETGGFGIQPGHTGFVTPLAVSVLSYRTTAGAEHHLAVRGGVLRVRGGNSVEVATREAVAGDDLNTLENAVLGTFRARSNEEATARTRAAQLNMAVVRHLYRYVHASRTGESPPLIDEGLESST